jgi:hypothetical protein
MLRRQHPHGRRLAGSVRPEQAEHGALGDGEADSVHRPRLFEMFDQIDRLDGVVLCHARQPRDRIGQFATDFRPQFSMIFAGVMPSSLSLNS